MVRSAVSQASILVASDSPTEAALVKTLLEDDFERIEAATDPDSAIEGFQRCHPVVVIMAFRDLQAAEDLYLGIHRIVSHHPPRPHRAILLCGKEGVQQAYERCRRGLFDDYVVFWPVTHDVTRLHMSVYSSLDVLQALRDQRGLLATCAEQVHRLAEMDSLLSEKLSRTREHNDLTGRAVAGAEHGTSRALDTLSVDLVNTASPNTRSDSLAERAVAIEQCQSEALAPHMDAACALGALAVRERCTIMVIDDDDFQRTLIAQMLESAAYQVMLAANGTEAMSMLCGTRPDLILTDFIMPEMDGIELTRRIKADRAFGGIPIVMTTGHSEREIVCVIHAMSVHGFTACRSSISRHVGRGFHAMSVQCFTACRSSS